MQEQVQSIPREVIIDSDLTLGVAVRGVTLSVLKKNLTSLSKLYAATQEANESYSAEVKAVAEKAGLLPSVVKRFVKAREKGDEKAKQEAHQMSLVFEELSDA